jgi:CubicO group peptidase (beta-lactamase class C family)
MRFTRMLLLSTITAIAASGIHAQNAALTPLSALDAATLYSIDAFVTAELARQKIPGAEVGIYSRGRVLLAKGYGLANVELDVPVKPETIMQSGSVGKQFVSAAIMILVEDGKISLDDSVTKYFPEAPATWKPILIRNLLSHTSGLSEYESDDRIGPKGAFYLRLDFTEAELATKIETLPIEWAPGSKWAYRNTNYVLLGFIIHKITGKRYDDFLAERIFKPLGMTSTRLVNDRDIIPNRAAGYELDDGHLKNQEWVSPTFNSTADGTLYFNVEDMAKWDEALNGTTLLKQSSLDRMWTVYPLNDGKPNPAGYGFAWEVGDQNGHKRIEHSGAWQGFTCNISRYPDDSLTVVVLTNLAYANTGLMTHVVAGLADPPLMPARLTAIPDDKPEIGKALAKVLDKLATGEDIRSQVTVEALKFLTPEAEPAMKEMLEPLWPGGTLALVQREPVPDAPGQLGSTFRLKKGSAAMLVYFVLNAEGKISDLEISGDREYQ